LRAQNVPALIDVDRVVAEYCGIRGESVPEKIDDLVSIHIAAIMEKLAAVCSESSSIRGSETVDSRKAAEWTRDLLEIAALAGALGAATRLRVPVMLVGAVINNPPKAAN
jgi:hypothetical protein